MPVHDPLPHVCVHEASSAHSSEQAPDPQTRLQIDPLSHVAAHVSLPEQVNVQLDPAVHKQSCVAEHVSLVVVIAASMPPSLLDVVVVLVPLLPHASIVTEKKARSVARCMSLIVVARSRKRTTLDGDLLEKNRAISSRTRGRQWRSRRSRPDLSHDEERWRAE